MRTAAGRHLEYPHTQKEPGSVANTAEELQQKDWLRVISEPAPIFFSMMKGVIILNGEITSVKQFLEKETTYEIKGKKFIVQPVFKNEGKETLGTILLRLITVENKTA